MRGKLPKRDLASGPARNIPAYAGKTSSQLVMRWLNSEHPRVCGENTVAERVDDGVVGTSPRMRGKLCFLVVCGENHGNIPAYAGKTAPEFPFTYAI